MSHLEGHIGGNIDDFGMDTITLAGPLKAKLEAIKGAGFTQVMLLARDLVGHPEGWRAAVQEVKDSGLRVTGFQVLRDFEGLSGHLHDYKVDIAKSMLEMCHALGCTSARMPWVDRVTPTPELRRPLQGSRGLTLSQQFT